MSGTRTILSHRIPLTLPSRNDVGLPGFPGPSCEGLRRSSLTYWLSATHLPHAKGATGIPRGGNHPLAFPKPRVDDDGHMKQVAS